MLKTYLKESLTLAARSSWRAANGLSGAAIAGIGLIWPGVQKFTSRADWWADAANWFGSFAIYAGIAWTILFILQFVFVAPFQLWRNERSKNENSTTEGQSKIDRSREIVEHDKKLAARVRELFPEAQKQKLTSDLWNQHAYWNTQGNLLIDVTHFLSSAEAHFLEKALQRCVKDFVDASDDLLDFIGKRFFTYPREQRDSNLMFAMQPSWNLDREGNGSVEQQEKYDALTGELEGHVKKMSNAYDELIRAFHTQLLA